MRERPRHFFGLLNGISNPILRDGESVDCHAVDKRLAERSLEWAYQCAADPNCLLAAANHDPAVQEQVIEL